MAWANVRVSCIDTLILAEGGRRSAPNTGGHLEQLRVHSEARRCNSRSILDAALFRFQVLRTVHFPFGPAIAISASGAPACAPRLSRRGGRRASCAAHRE